MLLALAGAAAGLWVLVLLAPWRPWSTREQLDPVSDDRDCAVDLSNITALVPARNESAVIARTVGSLRRQGDGLRIVVIDDESTDGTSEIARRAGGDACEIVSGTAVPTGWVGKLWALEQGRARVRTGWILLVDADIELSAGLVAALVRRRDAADCQLVSLMAVLEMRTTWEKLLVPAFVYFFKLLYPFHLSNGRSRVVAAAAGGCVLVETSILDRIGGFAALRGALIDDCALARHVKRAGGRTWIGLSHAVSSHRRMESLGAIWRMVARSAFAQLRYSTLLLIGCVGLLALAFWIPPLGMLASDPRTRFVALTAGLAMVVTYVPTLTFYRRSPLWAVLLPATGTLYLLITVSSAIRHWRGLGAEWKGRVYGGG
jgi:hopene-associated glycosyltransferase HpnB